MIKIKILLENSTCKKELKNKHGLSIFIEAGGKKLLMDTGPDGTFLKNAYKMNVDISAIDYLFFSHSHFDHTGGFNSFIKVNDNAPAYLLDETDSKYYSKLLKFFKIPIGLRNSKEADMRITTVDKIINIDNNIVFSEIPITDYLMPSLNNQLFKKVNGKLIQDDFKHEGVLIIKDENELVIFNGCSHKGLINTIETAKHIFPGLKIRSYVGGLHLFNPLSGKNEKCSNLNILIDYVKKSGTVLYTGHCTGDFSFNFLNQKLDGQLKKISTGMELNV